MIHHRMVVGPLQCNCVILGCERTKEAVIIDPGDEARQIVQYVRGQGLSVKYLLHTHAHFDHFGGTEEVYASLKAAPCLHRADNELYENLPVQGKMFGYRFDPAPPIEKFLEDNEILIFGDHRLEVMHTPGHSPGSLCFRLHTDSEAIFSGDTLFKGSIGRTDLWGGSQDKLIGSIKERLLVLEGEVPVHPGHGPSTRIADEKRHNPFLS